MLLKREAEISKIVVDLRAYSDEKKRLENALEAAKNLNTPSSSNSSDATFGNLPTPDAEQEKSRRELTGIIESITRLAESLLKLPGIA